MRRGASHKGPGTVSLPTVSPAPSHARHLFPAHESQHDCANPSPKFGNPGGGTGKDKFSAPLSTGVFLRDEPNVGDLGEEGRPGRYPLRPAWKTQGTRILPSRAEPSRAAPSGPHPKRSCKARWAHLQSRAGPCPRPRRPSAAVTHHSGSLRRPTGCRAAVCFLLTSGAASGGRRSRRDLHTGRACRALAPPRPRLLGRADGAGAHPGSLQSGGRSPANRGPSSVGRSSGEKPHLAQHAGPRLHLCAPGHRTAHSSRCPTASGKRK